MAADLRFRDASAALRSRFIPPARCVFPRHSLRRGHPPKSSPHSQPVQVTLASFLLVVAIPVVVSSPKCRAVTDFADLEALLHERVRCVVPTSAATSPVTPLGFLVLPMILTRHDRFAATRESPRSVRSSRCVPPTSSQVGRCVLGTRPAEADQAASKRRERAPAEVASPCPWSRRSTRKPSLTFPVPRRSEARDPIVRPLLPSESRPEASVC